MARVSQAHLDAQLALDDDSFVQLHTGDPGASGTANVLAGTPRKALGLGAPSTDDTHRARSNAAIVRWDGPDVGDTSPIPWITLWDSATGGVFRRSLEATGDPPQASAGIPFEIPVDGVVVSQGEIAT